MRRSILVAISACAVLGFTLISVPAQADSIVLPPDPLIGVLGGGGDSPPITDGSAFALTNADCAGFFASSSFFCAPYDYTGLEGYTSAIFSFDLAFWDHNGVGIPFSAGYDDSDSSQFSGISSVPDQPYLVRLSAVMSCDGDVCFPESPIIPGDVLIFAESTDEFPFFGGFVSIQAVNGSNAFQTNVATAGKDLESVPEPATLALLGTGMLGAALRRRLRRRR